MRRPTRAAAIAGLVLLSLSACTSSPQPTTSSTPPAPAPSPSASAAPESVDIPVDGDDAVRIEWSYLDGADPADPVVDVARRTTALILLAQGSPLWGDATRIDELAAAVTDGSDAAISPAQAELWAASAKEPLPYPVRVLVQPPRVDGDVASVFVCVDLSAFVGEEPVVGSGTGITRIDLRAGDGEWRTTSYDVNTEDWTHDDYQHCKDF